MGAAPLDKSARPLRKAIIWADQRALEQERWIGERLSFDEVYQITGHRLSSSYSLAKILWNREHEPAIYQATHKFVQAKDSMVARLTGVFVTDPSDASSMNNYDLHSGEWSGAILDAVELPVEKLPEIRQSIDVVGEVRVAVADEVGVAAGTPEPIYNPDFSTFTFAHVIPDMFMPTGTMQAVGAVLVGGVGVGLYANFPMIETMNDIAATVMSDKQAGAIYDKMFPIFNQLYDALAPVYGEIAGL